MRQVARSVGVNFPLKGQNKLNSLYGYSEQDPINNVDRTGENTVAIGDGIGFSIGGPPGAVVGGLIGGGLAVGA